MSDDYRDYKFITALFTSTRQLHVSPHGLMDPTHLMKCEGESVLHALSNTDSWREIERSPISAAMSLTGGACLLAVKSNKQADLCQL